MAELRYPASDRNRLALLEKCSKEATRDRLATAPYLVANLETAVDTFIAAYRPAIKLVQELRGQRGLEVDEKQTAVDAFFMSIAKTVVGKTIGRGKDFELFGFRVESDQASPCGKPNFPLGVPLR